MSSVSWARSSIAPSLSVHGDKCSATDNCEGLKIQRNGPAKVRCTRKATKRSLPLDTSC